jgi:hypothetical protein
MSNLTISHASPRRGGRPALATAYLARVATALADDRPPGGWPGRIGSSYFPPGVAAFLDSDGGDRQPGASVQPPPAQPGIDSQAEQVWPDEPGELMVPAI